MTEEAEARAEQAAAELLAELGPDDTANNLHGIGNFSATKSEKKKGGKRKKKK